MMQKSLVGVAAGLLSALLMMAFLSQTLGGVILMLLAGLPLFGAGLGWGAASLLAAAASAGLAIGVVAGPALSLVYMLLFAAPIVTLSGIAIRRVTTGGGSWRWASSTSLVLALMGVGVALFGFAVLQLAQLGGDPQAALEQLFEESTKAYFEQTQNGGKDLVAHTARIVSNAPALMVAWWLLALAANGCLGQALAVRFEHQIRPTPAMVEIGLPRWFAGLTLVLAAAAFAAPGWFGYVARNLLVLQGVGYFMAGLAVLHSAVQHRRNKLALLMSAYVVVVMLLLTTSPLVAIVAVVGLIEPWAQLRMRLARGRLR
jgi:hypothetical protein